MTGQAGPVDQPQEQAKQRQHQQGEKHGEEPHLFLVDRRIALTLITGLKKHALAYAIAAESANGF
jgi:hypothetical protein